MRVHVGVDRRVVTEERRSGDDGGACRGGELNPTPAAQVQGLYFEIVLEPDCLVLPVAINRNWAADT